MSADAASRRAPPAVATSLFAVCLAVDAFLLAAHWIAGRAFLLDFDLASAHGIGAAVEAFTSWLAAILALGCAATELAPAAGACAAATPREGRALAWVFVAVVLVVLGIEAATGLGREAGANLLHLRFFGRLRELGGSNLPQLAWVLTALPFLALAIGAVARVVASRLIGEGEEGARAAALAGLATGFAAPLVEAANQGPVASFAQRALASVAGGAALVGASLLVFGLARVVEERLRRDRATRHAVADEGETLRRTSARAAGVIAGGLALVTAALAAALATPWNEGLAPAAWRLRASEGARAAAAVVDRNRATRWATDRPQRPGQWLEVDLGTAHRIERVVLYVAGSLADSPRALALETGPAPGTLLPYLAEPIEVPPGRASLTLTLSPPVSARVLRFVQRGEHPLYHWSVHELYLYGEELRR